MCAMLVNSAEKNEKRTKSVSSFSLPRRFFQLGYCSRSTAHCKKKLRAVSDLITI